MVKAAGASGMPRLLNFTDPSTVTPFGKTTSSMVLWSSCIRYAGGPMTESRLLTIVMFTPPSLASCLHLFKSFARSTELFLTASDVVVMFTTVQAQIGNKTNMHANRRVSNFRRSGQLVCSADFGLRFSGVLSVCSVTGVPE